MSTQRTGTRFRVRKMTSGRSSQTRWYVYDLVSKSRVSVHAAHSQRSAQIEADRLNIGDMIRDHAADPRPYTVRYAEAEAAYYAARGDE